MATAEPEIGMVLGAVGFEETRVRFDADTGKLMLKLQPMFGSAICMKSPQDRRSPALMLDR